MLAEQAQRVTQLRQLRRLLVEQEERLRRRRWPPTSASRRSRPTPPRSASRSPRSTTPSPTSRRGWRRERVKVPLTFKPGLGPHRQPAARRRPRDRPVELPGAARRWRRSSARSPPATPSCSSRPSWRRRRRRRSPSSCRRTSTAAPSPSSRAVPTRRRRCWPSASTTSSTPAAREVGKIVMRAAAEHLTPVTLELGGKSPAIVAGDADVDVAAHRIAWGRFTNAGQTCVAPDYVLVHRAVEDQFLGGVLRAVHDFYGDDPRASPDYGRIVNDRHFDRLTGLIAAGGYEAVVTGGVGDRQTRYLGPDRAGRRATRRRGDAGGDLRADPARDRGRPTSTRRSASSTTARRRWRCTCSRTTTRPPSGSIERTTSGGVTVNHTMLHVAVPDLPFGGVGASGIGRVPRQGRLRHVLPPSLGARQAGPPRPVGALPAVQAVEGSRSCVACCETPTGRSGHRAPRR